MAGTLQVASHEPSLGPVLGGCVNPDKSCHPWRSLFPKWKEGSHSASMGLLWEQEARRGVLAAPRGRLSPEARAGSQAHLVSVQQWPRHGPWLPCHSGDPPSRAVPLGERMHKCPSPSQPPDRPPRLRGAQPTVIPGSAGRTPGPRHRQRAGPDRAFSLRPLRAGAGAASSLGPLVTSLTPPWGPSTQPHPARPPPKPRLQTPRQRAGLRPADPGGTRTLSP